MSRFREMLSLVEEYIEGSTGLSLEEIEERCYEYYRDGELEPTGYDHIMGRLEEYRD